MIFSYETKVLFCISIMCMIWTVEFCVVSTQWELHDIDFMILKLDALVLLSEVFSNRMLEGDCFCS